MTDWTGKDNDWNIIKDDYSENFGNFDWKETPLYNHPKKCKCPKHEAIVENRRASLQSGSLKMILKLCPGHFKAYHETFDESQKKMYKTLSFLQKIAFKFVMLPPIYRRLIEVRELTHAQSDICFWCKFGSGGRGIKRTVSPDIP